MVTPDPQKKEEARQRREALKKQVRHPYITGQQLKGPEPVPAPAPPKNPPASGTGQTDR